MKSQGQWLHFLKTDSCWSCHQMGDKATREIPKSLGHFDSSTAAWARRILSGQAGNNMVSGLGQLGSERVLPMFADWTDRIAAGELPPTPPRPQGAERNIVVTEWDWADPKAYLHDEIATDKSNPTLNANGAIYGAGELSVDYLPVLDPVSAVASQVRVPVRDPKTPSSADDKPAAPSPYWGDEAIWHSQANVHNPMFDAQGRVWITSRIRPSENPAFCKEGSSHHSAVLFPLKTSGRQLAVYDKRTKQVTLINTCFGTHHLVFAEDANVPIATGNGNDALLALLPDSGKFVVLRVPYPMGFYAKGMDGRIDDPKAGWKGKGLWATYGTRTPFHAEGGKGTTSKVLHFQLRPDPLAH
jgi:hypothetical protein